LGWLRGGRNTRGLRGVNRVELLGQNQFIVTGDPQAVLFTVVQYDDFLLLAKKLRAGDSTFCHVCRNAPFP
jgi:hypothetical protein